METELFSSSNGSYNVTCCGPSLPYCSCNLSNASLQDQGRSDSNIPDLGPPLYMYIYVTVINAIVFLVGIMGNVLVIQVVARTRSMRRRMNYFLVSLSIADLLVLVICLPVALLEFYGKEKWFIGEAMCKIVPFLENASHHCSVLTLLAIGFERYYAICHPLRETMGSRVVSTAILIPAVWVLSCVVSFPFAIISNIEIHRYYDDSLVDVCRTDMSSKLSRAYIIFIFTVFLVLPLLLLTAMYAAIIRTLAASTMGDFKDSNISISVGGRHSCQQENDHIRNSKAMASRRQVVRMMVAVMALYFLCLLPIRCVQIWRVFGPSEDLEALGFEGYLNLICCVRILIIVNSAGNPIIYGLLSSNFRAAFRQSLSNCRTGKQDRWRYNTTYYSNNHHHHYLYQQSQGSPNHGHNHPISLMTSVRKDKNAAAREDSDGVGKDRESPSYSPALSRIRNTKNVHESPVPGVRQPLLIEKDDNMIQTEILAKDCQLTTTRPTYV